MPPARTISEAQENARKMGVSAEYNTTNIDLANSMNETLNEARNAGFTLPKNVQIDASLFKDVRNRRNNPASYILSLDDVVVNPGADFWKNSVIDAAANKSSGFWTTASTRHPLRHELGHAIHKANIGLTRFRVEFTMPLDKEQKRLARKNVSRYGSSSRGEFVAEVFSGLMDGASYADPVMALYKKFGGPLIS